MTRLKMRASAGIVTAAAVMAAATASWASPTDTLKLSIGVRETGTTAAIGADGGTANGIEWIHKDGQTLTADGTWQHFVFNFGTDPVVGFAGGTADGTLSSSNMMGTLENIRILNSTPTTSEISLYLDDITLTVNSSASGKAPGTYVLADFESQAVGDNYMFDKPSYSGSTSGFLASDPDSAAVVDNTTTSAHGGNNSLFVNFKFNSPSSSAWDRLTTFQAPGAPNPAIDFTSGNSLSFWAKVTIAAPTMFWGVDADGDWWDQNNWSSATDPIPGQPSDALTGAGTDTARFLSAITADHTVTLSQDTFLNQLILDNAHSYTIQSSGAKLYMTAANTTAGTATIAASSGTQNVNADIQLNASLNLSTPGTSVLNIGNTIDLADVVQLFATDPNPQLIITKDGTGTANIHDLKYGYLRVSEGTLTVAPGSALNLVTNGKGAGAMPAGSPPQALYVATAGTLNLTNTSPTLTYRWTNTTDMSTSDTTATLYNDGTINMSGGTLDTFRVTIVSTRGNLNLSNGAAVNVAKYLYGSNITVADSSVTIAANGGTGTSGGVSNIDDLTITGTGYYEVNNNDMVINNGASSPEQIAKIRGYLASGRNGGSWDGAGIRSAAAGAEANHLTALGYATGADLFGDAGGTFSGFGVGSTALLIKYTWYGDANLDGKITADDYALIDRGAALGVASWVNGDFNYDGVINSDDYLLIDTSYFSNGGGTLSPAFLAMREAQFGSAYVTSLIAAVPEPTTLSLVGLAGLGLLGRRRRQA